MFCATATAANSPLHRQRQSLPSATTYRKQSGPRGAAIEPITSSDHHKRLALSVQDHLLVALGIRAIELGFSAQYFRFDELMPTLKADAHLPASRIKARKYTSITSKPENPLDR
jgi:hypothetical protein